MAALLAGLAVLLCTLYPFHARFSNDAFASLSDLLLVRLGPDGPIDVLENVLLFLPLGFTSIGYLEHRGVQPLAATATVLILSFCGSYMIEVLQLFMPGRFTSLTDVLSNTAGAALGLLYYRLWRARTT
jgi:glycopeptide antibiotics resistance protein